MADVNLQVSVSGQAISLKPVAKELNYENSEPFRLAMEEALAKNAGVKKIMMDMSEVEFLFSAGIGLLTFLLRYTREHELAHPSIVQAQPFVKETLEVVGMHNTFKFFDSVELAMAD